MNDKKKRLILKNTIFAMGLMLILVTSYAFVRLNENNMTKNPLTMNLETAKNIVLTYKDCISDVVENSCSEINGALSPGGTLEKTFSITNNNEVDVSLNIYFEEIVNSFKNDELVYSLFNTDNDIDTPLVENKSLPNLKINHKITDDNITIRSGETQNYKVVLKFLDQDYDQNANLRSNFYVRIGLQEIEEPTTYQNKLALSSKSATPDYTNASTSDEGVYKLNDNYGASYYYRGNVQNNYLKYAGFYWRIVRMNGDGTVRIMYDGTTPHSNDEVSDDRVAVKDVEWNKLANDNKYVGYMYGNASTSKSEAQKNSTSSNIKTKLEEWYKTNIYDAGYDFGIADSIFCNDRSTEESMGYGNIPTTYNARNRTTPTFVCENKNDAYTTLDPTNGNTSLKYPVGLITLDELIAAGSGTTLSGSSTNNYTNRGTNYWTMTPYEYNQTAQNASVNENGGIEKSDVYTKKSIVPVINLTSNLLTSLTGTGTAVDPYVVEPKIFVTFDSNGGGRNYSKEVKYGGTYGEFPDLKREGYFLEGWYTDPLDGEKIESSTPVTKTEPHTLYARWIQATPFVVTSSNISQLPGWSYSVKEYEIPATFLGTDGITYYVTSIGDEAFRSSRYLTSVTIPDSVTSIGNYAFAYSGDLTSVTIPDSVTSIGDHAFASCGDLTSVTIPDSVTEIGNYAFSGCNKLASVSIGNGLTSIGHDVFSGCSSSITININENNNTYKSINSVIYTKDEKTIIQYPSSKAGYYTIPASVTSIGDHAFSSCNFTSITIPDNVTSIGDFAFSQCKLESISIENGVTSIGDHAFSNCSSLTSITIPDGVTSIGDYAFWYCNKLTSITIPDSVTSIGDYAFQCCGITSITIPISVTSIGNSAFAQCTNLTKINVDSNNITYKSTDGILFTKDGTTLLQYPAKKTNTSYIIPNGVTSIGGYAFYYCRDLTSITMPTSVTSIGDYAFGCCSKLPSITIPDNVASVGKWAFYSCSSLTSISFPANVTSIGDNTFNSCSNLTEINVDSNNITYKSTDGVLFTKDGTTLLQYPTKKNSTSYIIPDNVTSIRSYAFMRCSNLTSITMPASVTSIGEYAFMSCSKLTSITIPYGVTSIEQYTFAYCSKLTSVTIPASVTSIGAYAFQSCNINTIIYKGTTYTSTSAFETAFTSTSGNTIGNWAFY